MPNSDDLFESLDQEFSSGFAVTSFTVGLAGETLTPLAGHRLEIYQVIAANVRDAAVEVGFAVI